MKRFICLMLVCCLVVPALVRSAQAKSDNPKVVLETSMGNILVECFADKAPKTVANFLQYVREGKYNGTIFHRVINGFMIQGGGFTSSMQRVQTHQPIANEARADVPNNRGTLSMARTNDPHSATNQFFINLKDNDFLNFTSATRNGYGYCVFGKVLDGMSVVDKIATVPTQNAGAYRDVPSIPVVITKAYVMGDAK